MRKAGRARSSRGCREAACGQGEGARRQAEEPPATHRQVASCFWLGTAQLDGQLVEDRRIGAAHIQSVGAEVHTEAIEHGGVGAPAWVLGPLEEAHAPTGA